MGQLNRLPAELVGADLDRSAHTAFSDRRQSPGGPTDAHDQRVSISETESTGSIPPSQGQVVRQAKNGVDVAVHLLHRPVSPLVGLFVSVEPGTGDNLEDQVRAVSEQVADTGHLVFAVALRPRLHRATQNQHSAPLPHPFDKITPPYLCHIVQTKRRNQKWMADLCLAQKDQGYTELGNAIGQPNSSGSAQAMSASSSRASNSSNRIRNSSWESVSG